MKVDKIEKGSIIKFIYTNWKELTEERMAIVLSVKHGTNDFYSQTEKQFFIYAYDLDRRSERSFAVANIKNLEVKGNVHDVMSYLSEGSSTP